MRSANGATRDAAAIKAAEKTRRDEKHALVVRAEFAIALAQKLRAEHQRIRELVQRRLAVDAGESLSPSASAGGE